MSSISNTLSLSSLHEANAAWKLLRATNAPAIIAILHEHLGGTQRRLPVHELVNLVEADIEELRFKTDLGFTRSAQAYCEQWRTDGYLIRRPVEQARQETYELSAGALHAIRFATQLLKPPRSATQSRLNTIIDRINKLALDTDPNATHRRAALLEERARIDKQLEELEAGNFNVIGQENALERTHDIISLAQEIPADFLRVRADFEQISKQLHVSIINSEDSSADILEDVFAGIDRIEQSPSGRSFRGFYSLLRNPELAEGVQAALDAILECDFAENLPLDERRFLRSLLQEFLAQSQEANAVMTSFARGLRRFVQNQNYHKDRLIKQQIDRALGTAHRLVDVYPCGHKMHFSLNLTSLEIRPVSRWQLKNPAETRTEPVNLNAQLEAPPISLAQLRQAVRETEIDFTELVSNVNKTLSSRAESLANSRTNQANPAKQSEAQSFPSVADVLDAFPATQGVASVVGLMSLAEEQGRHRHNETEIVHWTTKHGEARMAHIRHLEFYQEVTL